jgi:serine/threonine protein kinase
MDAVMRDGPRPVADVLHRTRQLADVLDFAASAGVHHGMMAPCDVILDGERTGVTGFGLAQALIKVGMPAEAGPPYGSPQRLAGAPPSRADDVYSLAAITLELLIGTPPDPDQDREAQGLPARRHVQRPAPHETRAFTTIAGVDAGKLRAAFAAAFSEEPGERPSTANEFVNSFQNAISNRRDTDEPAATVVAVPVISDARKDPPSAPGLNVKRADDGATPEPPSREGVVTDSRETLAISQPLIRESNEHEPREREPESLAPAEPIVALALSAEVTAPRAGSMDGASSGIPFQSWSWAFLAAAVGVVGFSGGFGSGLVIGHFSRPSTEPTDISRRETVAQPQPARAGVEDPKPTASKTPTGTPILEETVSSSEPIAATEARQRAAPAVESGSLLIRSMPAGSGMVVDGKSRGVTPLVLGEIATSAPAQVAASTNSTGSLQVTSRPSGAQVYIDDNLIGTTPVLLSEVAAGSRLLRIELSGYKIWTTSVQIKPGARFRVLAGLEP